MRRLPARSTCATPFPETSRFIRCFGRSPIACGSGRHARVRLLLDDLPARRLDVHARTILRSQDGAFASADVHLTPSPEAIERIAHEFEHILEQFDGVDLLAQVGTGAVWNSGDDSFETRRAIETGRRVAREVTMGVDIGNSSGGLTAFQQ